MKYYSEELKKVFDSVEDLENAEKEQEEKKAHELALREEKKERAHEVEDAYKKYLELRSKFINDYGSYHMSLTEKDLPKVNSIFDLLEPFWF